MVDWWQDYPWRQIQTNLREISNTLDIGAEQVVRCKTLRPRCHDQRGRHHRQLSDRPAVPFPEPLPGGRQPGRDHRCLPCGQRSVSSPHRLLQSAAATLSRPTRNGPISVRPVRSSTTTATWPVCLNGDFQQLYTPKILEELLTRLPFDGIFFNMGGYQPATTAATTTVPASAPTAGVSSGRCLAWNCRS